MLDMRDIEPQPVSIPTERYQELNDMGVLWVITWRAKNKALKGVVLLFVSPSLRNDAILDAATDVLYVAPQYRGNSKVFIAGVKQLLKQKKVNYWYVSSRDKKPIAGFLEKTGFEPLERLFYCKL